MKHVLVRILAYVCLSERIPLMDNSLDSDVNSLRRVSLTNACQQKHNHLDCINWRIDNQCIDLDNPDLRSLCNLFISSLFVNCSESWPIKLSAFEKLFVLNGFNRIHSMQDAPTSLKQPNIFRPSWTASPIATLRLSLVISERKMYSNLPYLLWNKYISPCVVCVSRS